MSRYDLSREELASLLGEEPTYRVNQVWDGLYRRLAAPGALSELPQALRERLDDEPALGEALTLSAERIADGGATVKWLFSLEGGVSVETVLMYYAERATVCVSTQAGCAMACPFCATGQAGFSRQLTRGEILEQVVRAARAASQAGRRLSNVVFMGMGEPLANYDAVLAAARRIVDDIGISARHVTISTVGIVPGIRRLAVEGLPVNLAVSLHAADDELRDRLVPINRRYPLGVLVPACLDYFARTGRRVSLEWALMAGTNDRASDAAALVTIARELHAHVNLIPLNPTTGGTALGLDGSTRAHVLWFRDALRARGVNATVRANRGRTIEAACGQLAGSERDEAPAPVAIAPRSP